MATTYTTKYYNDSAVARPQAGLHVRLLNVPFSALFAVNDIFKVAKLPKGAKLVNGWFIESADYDTSTNLTYTLQVTDGTTTKVIISGATVGQAGGRASDNVGTGSLQTGWLNYKCATDLFRVELKIAAGPGTSASGNVLVGIAYTMDTEAGD